MATFAERVEIWIDAHSGGAVKGFEKTTEAALGTEVATSSLGKALPYVAVAAVAVGAAVYSTVNAYDEAHRSVLQLENSMQNNTLLAGSSKQKFLDLADSIQQKTAADGDQVVSAEAILGTFRLTQDQILALTPLVVDYARKFDTDLVTAAKQVGKAMDGQVGALKRNGVTIDENRFKTDRYGAVVDALRSQVGGFSEAEGKTFQGRLEQLKNNVGDLQEAIGGELEPVVTEIAGALAELANAAGDVGDVLGSLGVVGDALGEIFKTVLLGPIYGVSKAINIFGDTVGNLVGSYDATANSAKEYKAYLEAMGLSHDEVKAKLAEFRENQDKAKAATDGAAGALEQQTKALQGVVDAMFAKLNADLAMQGSMLAVESAQNAYNKSLQDNGADALETRQALNQYETAMVSAAAAAGKAAEQALGPNATGQEKARANTQAQIDTLSYLAATASPAAAAAIQAYIDKLKSTPEYWHTTITADDSQARRVIDGFSVYWNSKVAGLHKTVGLGASVPPTAVGGVFSSPQVRLIGEAGPEAVIPLSNPSRAAQVMAQAGLLGSGGGMTSYSINVTAGMGADGGQVGAAVVDAIKAYERRSGAAWRN